MATGFRNLTVYILKDIFDDWRRQGMKKDFARSVARSNLSITSGMPNY